MNATPAALPSDSPLPPAAVRNRALKFRLYLTAPQARRAAQWLWTAHAFRNTCVRLLEQMRWAGWQMQAYSRQRLPVDIRTALEREPAEGAAPAFFSGFNGWQYDDPMPAAQKAPREGAATATPSTPPTLAAWQYGLLALTIHGVEGNRGDEGGNADGFTAHEGDSTQPVAVVEAAHLPPSSLSSPSGSSHASSDPRAPKLLRTPTVDVLALQPFEEAFRERFMAGTAAIGLGYDSSEASNPWGWSWEAGSQAHEPIWDLKAYTGQSVARVLNAFLTAHLTRARNRLPAILEGQIIPKAQIAEAFHDLWVGWSPQRRQESLLLARFDWLTVPRTILDQVIQDLVKTVAKANKDRSVLGVEAGKRKQRKAGYPQPRSWNEAGSVRMQVVAEKNPAFRRGWEQQELHIPGLGPVHFRDRGRRLPSQPGQMLTLARTATGKWYLSFPCSEADLWESFKHPKRVPPLLGSQPLPRDKDGSLKARAADAGVKNTMTTDEGKCYKTEQYLKGFVQ